MHVNQLLIKYILGDEAGLYAMLATSSPPKSIKIRTPKSPEIVVDKPSVPPHYDDSHLGPKASPKSTSQSAPISGKFKVDGTSNESGASGGGSSSASDGNWEQVPHQHNKPLDGRNMNRELSTPAFNGEKKYVSMFE